MQLVMAASNRNQNCEDPKFQLNLPRVKRDRTMSETPWLAKMKETNNQDKCTRALPKWHNTPVDFHKERESYLSGVSIFCTNKSLHLNRSKTLTAIIFVQANSNFFIGDLKLN